MGELLVTVVDDAGAERDGARDVYRRSLKIEEGKTKIRKKQPPDQENESRV